MLFELINPKGLEETGWLRPYCQNYRRNNGPSGRSSALR